VVRRPPRRDTKVTSERRPRLLHCDIVSQYELIYSGRDASEDGGGSSGSGPLENLWPFFNPTCHSGFDGNGEPSQIA
jgi:hypothetical protein